MAVVYPASLGLDEGLADLLIKGWAGMLSQPDPSHPVLYISIVAWCLSAFASALWWMRKVFARYETTAALPIEYGSLNFANVGTGLLFYQEYRMMEGSGIALILGGLVVIIAGIAVGTLRFGGRCENLV